METTHTQPRARRRFADRVATALVDYPPSWHADADLWVGAAVRHNPALRQALLQAPEAADRAGPAAVQVRSGVGGLLARMHAADWSLGFRQAPAGGPVLLITDGLPDLARRVDTDPDWATEIDAAVAAVTAAVIRASIRAAPRSASHEGRPTPPRSSLGTARRARPPTPASAQPQTPCQAPSQRPPQHPAQQSPQLSPRQSREQSGGQR